MLKGLPQNWISTTLGKRLRPYYKVVDPKDNFLTPKGKPEFFLGALLARIEKGLPVFLGNPEWKKHEWDFIKKNLSIEEAQQSHNGYIMIATGGTLGNIRFAMHTWDNLVASAKATHHFWGDSALNSLCCLPLYHVSGLMQVVRALVSGGDVTFSDFEDKNLPALHSADWAISCVPTQLKRLLQSDTTTQWLKQFKALFVGGASTQEGILKEAQKAGLNVVLTYGMTESASMICALPAENFLVGQRGVGHPLSHARIVIEENDDITIEAESLFYGYYPAFPQKVDFWSCHDEGCLDKKGNLHIKGRKDRMIITGGEKVDPHEVEKVAMNVGTVESLLITGVEDPEWGERVIAFYCPKDETFDEEQLRQYLKTQLSSQKVPKDWIPVERLPFTPHGKIDHGTIKKLWNKYKKW